MGRPRKEETVDNPIDSFPENGKAPASYKLKICPRCGEGKPDAPTQDIHKNWRCFCPVCKFWDSVVSLNAADAADKWNAAGGPNPAL